MNRGFSFLHIADIHLGRAFSDLSVYNDKMKLCNNACELAFKKVINLAIEKKVDFVLVAGDTFDDDEHDLHTKLVFRKSLETLADNGIKSFVICGNHDPLSMYKAYESYFKFDEKYNGLINITGVTTESFTHIYDEGFVKIHSVSFKTDEMSNPCEYLQERDSTCFNIGLIHCDLDKADSKYAPCSRQDLKNLGYDYYALGHIHIPTVEEEKFVYSGSIQGRTRKETETHGCYYVKVENGSVVEREFLQTDCIRFMDMDIDCADCVNKLDVFNKIDAQIGNLSNDVELYLVQINLTGVSPASKDLKSNDNLLDEYLQETTAHRAAVYEMNDYTVPETDMQELLEDNGVVGIIAQNIGKNIDDIYEEIKEHHKKIYKSLGIDKESEQELFDSLTVDKEMILAQVETELKSLCSEIYEN